MGQIAQSGRAKPTRQNRVAATAVEAGGGIEAVIRLRGLLAGVEEDVVVCGHTHVQFDRTVDGIRVVNAGSVGAPYEAEPGAYWALVEDDVEAAAAITQVRHLLPHGVSAGSPINTAPARLARSRAKRRMRTSLTNGYWALSAVEPNNHATSVDPGVAHWASSFC